MTLPAARAEEPGTDQAAEDEPVSTPGGVPAIPAVTVTTTGTIAAVSSAGLAGGPVGAVVAAAAVVVGTAAVALARAPRVAAARTAYTTRRPASRSAAAPAPRTGASRVSSFPRRTGSSGTGNRRSSSGTSGAGNRRSAARSGGSALQRTRQQAAAVRQARRSGTAEAARKGRTTAATDTTRARRSLADARREAKQQRRSQPSAGYAGTGTGRRVSLTKSPAGTGRQQTAGTRRTGAQNGSTGRSAGRSSVAGRLWRAGRGAAAQSLARAVRRTGRTDAPAGGKGTGAEQKKEPRGYLARRRAAYRQQRDAIRERWRAQQQGRIEERARTRARTRALRRSAARHQARRALAAMLATPLGALSLALWPFAKALRVRPPRWGRSVWQAVTRAAQEDRVARDIAAYEQHDQDEADRARRDRGKPGDVDRTRNTTDTSTNTGDDDVTTPAFDFREATADMLTRAQQAEPGGMMSVLASIETLPEAMASIAETFAAVASTCSPENMPLDPNVTSAMEDLHKALVGCVDAAEAIGEAFHTHHADDIGRHTDGRVQEEMWDVTRNQD
ncbi:hypothetical protein ACFUCH_35485 [Streptomyces olivaceus]|uniref:hypothetical protein n=1 Tax=Streptomyces olivaceus TaxID=47716 RepID=UPI00362BAC27